MKLIRLVFLILLLGTVAQADPIYMPCPPEECHDESGGGRDPATVDP